MVSAHPVPSRPASPGPTRRSLISGGAAAVALSAVTGPPAGVSQAATGRAWVPYTVTARDTATSVTRPLHEFRGLWVATVLNVDWPSRPGLSVTQQRAELGELIRLAALRGCNAVLLQVRAAGDRFYRSTLGEPWSRYLTGTLGQDPGWDPLEWAVAEASRRGLEVHAWANPFRVAMDTSLTSLHPGSFAARNPSFTYAYGGRRYLDPGRPEVRLHVRAVLAEIASRYGVAGVHLDDYFYPYPAAGQVIGDDASFALYGAGRTRATWRRDNVNRFVRYAGLDVHAADRRAVFSVSPFGIWRNRTSSTAGSDTAGLQAYDDLYADTRLWLREQWTDLFIPQLYWQQGHPTADYDVLSRWWSLQGTVTRTHIALGEAVYKVGDAGWTNPAELSNHVALGRGLTQVEGNAYYNASAVRADELGAMSRVRSVHYQRRALPLPVRWLNAARPPSPAFTRAGRTVSGLTLEWTLPAGAEPARWIAIWRQRAYSATIPALPGTAEDLLAVLPAATGAGRWGDLTAEPRRRYWYVVQAYSRTGTVSAAGSAIMVWA
ncbi:MULTISPECIES: glycoside hydrolase family 10 protein [Micrococcaceae]|uniref:glycoside hydrolase family 10 protein n=1 Tax=Micrococcaceae TaxID=1268 RepID=UPI00161607FE|nr:MULTISPECIES: family 10 glycosylhydrolase [Micrococcaceae]MBB5749672.1 uncharacterized lipoprotein YddW (UPF0748 family) [Micrococcus sp. TA1]HRO29995.1 family 10 glycosylhydrolase [Citricoccus sp.]